jgi:DNA-directed RNA polymerase subunit beta'
LKNLIDSIKSLGFYGSTISGISVSVFDNKWFRKKMELFEEAEKKVTGVENDYQEGLITIDERKRLSNDIWLKATDDCNLNLE